MVKNLPCDAGDTGSVPGPGRSHMPRSNEASMPQLLCPHSRACALKREKPHTTTREWTPLTTTREKSMHSNEDRVQPNKYIMFLKL